MEKQLICKTFKNRVGEIYSTKEGYEIEIIRYLNNESCDIRFLNTNVIIENISFIHIKRGNISNPFHPKIFGVGYYGVSKYRCLKIKDKQLLHGYWKRMLERCYGAMYQKKFPTYIGCSVCEEWKNLQNFAKWFYENYNPETMQGWHLDKDILVKGNKVYSPETCCFVPNEINVLFQSKSSNKNLPLGITMKKDKYNVRITKDGVAYNLGCYSNLEDALKIYAEHKNTFYKDLAEKMETILPKNVIISILNYGK